MEPLEAWGTPEQLSATLVSLGPPFLRSSPLWPSVFQGLLHLAVRGLGTDMN